MNLYDYLLSLEYTEDEAEETILRYEVGMPIPEKIRQDIKDFHKKDWEDWEKMKERTFGKKPKPKHPGGRPRKELSGITEEPANGSYYTVPEVAEALGVHVRTVQARLRDGTIKGKKISGEWRIYKESLKGEMKK